MQVERIVDIHNYDFESFLCQTNTNMAANVQQAEKRYKFDVHTKAIKKMFNKDTVDVQFTFPKEENQAIGAHKMLLSSISPVFEAMFNGNWKESKMDEHPLVDVTFNVFTGFLEYFYSGEVMLDGGNIGEILNLANKYDLPDLMSSCSSFLCDYVDVDNAIDCFEMARTFGFENLEKMSKEIICNNTLEALDSPEFLKCSENVLFEILSFDSFSCADEFIFDACIEWAKHECKNQKIDATDAINLRKVLGNNFSLIRFDEMDQKERFERVVRYRDIFSKDELVELIIQPSISVGNINRREFDYSFEFTHQFHTYILEDEPFFKLSAAVIFRAFHLPKISAEKIFGDIGADFKGSIWVKKKFTKFHKQYEIIRAVERDNDSDYCFLLKDVLWLDPRQFYRIQFFRNKAFESYGKMFMGESHKVKDIFIVFERNEFLPTTPFSALHFELNE